MLRLLAVLMLVPGVAGATDYVCRSTSASDSRIAILCEELRVQLRIDPVFSTWDPDECATEAWRQWLRDFDAKFVGVESRETVRDDVRTELEIWDANFPPSYTSSSCGDGEVNTDFGETCDLGTQNGVPGSGCNANCQPE